MSKKKEKEWNNREYWISSLKECVYYIYDFVMLVQSEKLKQTGLLFSMINNKIQKLDVEIFDKIERTEDIYINDAIMTGICIIYGRLFYLRKKIDNFKGIEDYAKRDIGKDDLISELLDKLEILNSKLDIFIGRIKKYPADTNDIYLFKFNEVSEYLITTSLKYLNCNYVKDDINSIVYCLYKYQTIINSSIEASLKNVNCEDRDLGIKTKIIKMLKKEKEECDINAMELIYIYILRKEYAVFEDGWKHAIAFEDRWE